MLFSSEAQAAAPPVVSACSGVSLQRSVVTDILRPVINGVVAPIQDTVNPIVGVVADIPIVGQVVAPLDIDVSGLLGDAAQGDPITLQAMNSDGILVGPNDRCDTQADSFTLRTAAGIAIGGNRITGLGANGAVATAGEVNSIAFGNGAATDAGAAGAIALGPNAAVGAGADGAIALGMSAGATVANSVAIGAGSMAARGAQAGYAAPGLAAPQSSTGEFSVGAAGAERQITNLAAGSAPTDAVNVAQLSGVSDALAALGDDAVTYDGATHGTITLDGPAGTAIANLADGTVAAGSTEAVNGGQLFTTNASIADLSTNVTNGGIGTVQYANAAAPTVPNGGVPTQELALVGAAPGPVGLHNVRDGNVAAGSTDAINGEQLFTIGTALDGLTDSAVQYDDSGHGAVTLGGIGAATPVALGNVAAGTLTADSTDAVNGGQLFATNAAVTGNTTAIADNTTAIVTLTTNVQNGGIGPVQYSDAATPDTPNGGVPSNDLALVGTGPGSVGLHNVGAGTIAAGSTDAINGGQLFALGDAVDGLSDLAVLYDDAGRTGITLGGAGAAPVALGNVADATLAANSHDAVNGGQLFATNANVTTNANAITNLTAIVQNGGIGALQYSNAATPVTANGGMPTNDVTFVGAADGAVGVHNVADGSVAAGSTDAVNGGQLFALGNAVNGLSGLAVQYDDAGRTSVTLGGEGAPPVTLGNVAAGTLAAGSTDAVNGGQLYATNANVAANTAAIANNTTAIAGNTTAIVNLSTSIDNGSVGPLRYSDADDPAVPNGGTRTNDVALVGADTGPVGVHNVAAGTVSATSTDAVNGSQLFALGQAAVNPVLYDTGADGARINRVTLAGGDAATPVTIANVAAGTLAAGSTEAVNGGQLAATNQAVVTAQTTATAALTLGQNSVQYDADGSAVTLAPDSAPVTVRNVAAGVSASDAVNLGQLDTGIGSAIAQSNAYTDSRIAAIGFDLRAVRRDANGGTAGALAAAGMPQAYEAGKGMVAMGVGTFQGQSAIAIGASKALNDGRTVFKIGATYDTRGRLGANAGAGLQF